MWSGFLCAIVSRGSNVLFPWFSLEGQFPFSPAPLRGSSQILASYPVWPVPALGPPFSRRGGGGALELGSRAPPVTPGAALWGRCQAWPRRKKPARNARTPWNSSSMVSPHLIPPLLFA